MVRCLALLFVGGLLAQGPTLSHFVFSDVGGATPAAVFEVDPVTGSVQPVHTLATAGAPQALLQDPIDGDLIVACEAAAGGGSELFRLHRVGGAYAEILMASLPGRVTGFGVLRNELFAAVDAVGGGLYRLPRRGGTPVLEVQLDNLTAIELLPYGYLVFAQTGRAGSPQTSSRVGFYDVEFSTFPLPSTSFADPQQRKIVGVLDLPTAVPRQLLAFDDGSFGMHSGYFTPPMQTLPTVQVGGNVAMRAVSQYSTLPMVLGGSPAELTLLDPWSPTLTSVSAALPGAPVDCSPGITRTAHSFEYGDPCGPEAVQNWWSAPPKIGTTVTVQGVSAPNALLLLVTGLDDYDFGNLPLPLPGGCLLHVRPDLVSLLVTSGSGVANLQVALPASPTFIGTVLHSQWLHYDPSTWSTSAAAAQWLGQ